MRASLKPHLEPKGQKNPFRSSAGSRFNPADVKAVHDLIHHDQNWENTGVRWTDGWKDGLTDGQMHNRKPASKFLSISA